MDVGETTIILDLPCLASQNHKENLLERKMKLMKKTFFGFYPKPHHSRSLLLTVTSYVQPLRFVPSQKFHRREGGESSGAGLFRRAEREKKRERELKRERGIFDGTSQACGPTAVGRLWWTVHILEAWLHWALVAQGWPL